MFDTSSLISRMSRRKRMSVKCGTVFMSRGSNRALHLLIGRTTSCFGYAVECNLHPPNLGTLIRKHFLAVPLVPSRGVFTSLTFGKMLRISWAYQAQYTEFYWGAIHKTQCYKKYILVFFFYVASSRHIPKSF